MKRLFLLCLLFLGGCGGVIGYVPTEEEAEAISRGEDPRANESSEAVSKRKSDDDPNRPRDNTGGLEANGEKREPKGGAGEPAAEPQRVGPGNGVVLRWVDCGLVIIEAEGKRERVRIPGVEVPRDFTESQEALDKVRGDFPTGTKLLLSYPEKSADGKNIIYRNPDGDLLANIKKQ